MEWQLQRSNGVPSQQLETWRATLAALSAQSSLVADLTVEDAEGRRGFFQSSFRFLSDLAQDIFTDQTMDPWTVNVSVSVTNWMGASDTTSTSVRAPWPPSFASPL